MKETCLEPFVLDSSYNDASPWTHYTVYKRSFVTPWAANIAGLDLAFELGEAISSTTSTLLKCSSRPHVRKVRFQHKIMLYVGSERDLIMTPWNHDLEVSHQRSSIFQGHLNVDNDVTSFMASPPYARDEARDGVYPPQTLNLMNDPQLVQQDEDDIPQFESDDESQASWSPEAPARSSWRTTLIFPIGGDATSLRLDWNDYECFHASIARELGLHAPDLYYVHHIKDPPEDLERAHVQAVIPQRALDHRPGALEHYVLVDVEFHSTCSTSAPEVVRRAHKLTSPISRKQFYNFWD